MPADIVGAARLAPLEHRLQRADVVLDIQPVAYLVALAVDGQLLAIESIRERRVAPLSGLGPVATDGKRRQETSVLGAAIDDLPVGDREDVLPEGIARSVGFDGGQISLPPLLDVVVVL